MEKKRSLSAVPGELLYAEARGQRESAKEAGASSGQAQYGRVLCLGERSQSSERVTTPESRKTGRGVLTIAPGTMRHG